MKIYINSFEFNKGSLLELFYDNKKEQISLT